MSTTLTFEVPRAVQESARSALALHKDAPLDDVSGLALAERLTEGRVTVEDLSAMHRFFGINADHHADRVCEARTAATDPLCRSWDLRGGAHGRVWAERHYKRLVGEGVVPADPYDALFKAQPDEIYARFQAGAWNWEYGLDSPMRAAKFYEDYHRATGNVLDLGQAFGESARAVGNAVHRRVVGPDPFREIARALTFEDIEYRLAAQVDRVELEESALIGVLFESLKPSIYSHPNAKLTAKMVWPGFVAYSILASERPELLVDVNGQGLKPPTTSQKPQNLTQYTDSVRTYVTFFHPQGSKYVDPTGTEFEGIEDEVEDFIVRAYYGRKLPAKKVQKLLGRMRRWTAANKLAGSAFHVYIADWRKGNWQHILDAIPEDADVRAAFTEFATLNPTPVDGIKLQQTLSDKPMLASIAGHAGATVNKSGLEFPSDLLDKPLISQQRKIAQTMSGKAAEKLGTPIGVQTLFLDSTKSEVVLLACFRDYPLTSSMQADTCILQRDNGSLYELADNVLRDAIANGSYTILKAHKDMVQVYTPAQKGPKDAAPESSPADVASQALLDPNVAEMLKSVPLMADFANVLGLGSAPNDAHKTATAIKWVTTESAFWQAAAKRGWEGLGEWSIDGLVRDIVGIVNITDPDLPGKNIYVLARDKVSKLVLADASAASKVQQGTAFPHVVPFAAAPEVTPAQLAKNAEPDQDSAQTQATDPLAKATAFYADTGFASEIYPLESTDSHAESVSQGWGPLTADSKWLYRPNFSLPLVPVEVSHAMKWTEIGASHTAIDIWFKSPLPSGHMSVDDESFAAKMVKGDAKPDTGDNIAPLEGGTPAPDVLTAFVAGQYLSTEGPLTRPTVGTEAANAMDVLDYQPPYDGQEWEDDTGNSWIYRETLHWRVSDEEVQVGHAWAVNGNTTVMTDAAVLGFVVGNTIKPLSSKGTTQNPFGFSKGDVVKHEGGFVWVVGKHGSPNAFYTVIPLTIGASVEWVSLDADVLEKTPGIEGNFMNPVALGPFLTGTSGYEKSTEESVSGVTVGDQVTLAHIQGQCIAFFTHADLGMQVVLAAPMPIPVGNQEVDAFDLGAGAVNWQSTDIAETSYEPDEPEPESIGSDEPDAETGNPLMAGTPQAFKKAKALNVTMANKAEDSTFTWDLGAILHYKSVKTRTIIGYGFKSPPKGGTASPVYLILTEKGNPNWVTTAKSNVEYGPVAGYDQGVVDALQPKDEDAAKAKFPKLNYKLSPKAKQVAEKNELVYVPAPKAAKFHVGAKVQWTTDIKGAQGEKTRILGWIATTTSEPAAIMDLGTDEFSVLPLPLTNTELSIFYELKSAIAATGEATFGKAPGSAPIAVTISYDPNNIITLPGPAPEGWDEPTPVKEPSLSHLPKGKHTSCGVLAVVPAGTSLMSGGDSFKAESASVVLFRPLNEFGGYKLAIPKGTVDKGESTIKAAVREFNEETGLTVKPVAHLGDFRANTSVTRLYVGYVTGGNPAVKKLVHEESEATVLVPIPLTSYQDLPWFENLLPGSGNKWQQAAIITLAEWLLENGIPQNFTVDEADQHSQVTGPSDVQPEKIAQAGTPEAAKGGSAIVADKVELWKTLLNKAPFPVTTAMLTALKQQVTAGVAASPVAFNAVRTREVGPKYGDVFETTAGTPYSCAGYISWEGDDGSFYHYLIGLSGAGLVEALPAQANGAPDFHTSTGDTAASKDDKDAWFSHPDPATNKRIQVVYHSGASSVKASQTGMQTFKKWLAEAAIPNAGVANEKIIHDVTSLFVPGAASEAIRDAVLQCLQARMKKTKDDKKKGAGMATGVSTVPSGDIAAQPAPATKPSLGGKSVYVATSVLSPLVLTTLNNPNEDKLIKVSVPLLTNPSKPTQTVQDEHGNRFLLKWRKGEPFAAETDKAAADLMEQVKGNVIPINTLEYEGQTVSMQPLFADPVAVSANPSTMSEGDMAELLSQHAFDMFVGDHDGNASNWIRVSGKLMAVDRGQAFKFMMMGVTEKLDPYWHAEGNIGLGLAKQLLIDWSEGKLEIPSSAFAAMAGTISNIELTFTTPTLLVAMTPYFDSLNAPANKRKAVLGKFDARRKTYEKDWTTVLKKLRKDFKWPGGTAKGLVIDKTLGTFDSTTATVAFGKEEETIVEEAVAAKWQGKSLRLDGPFIENQEVMVRRVLWEETPGQKVPAALIHFRVTKEGGEAMQASMQKKAFMDSTDEALGGPKRLKVDTANGMYEKIWAAIKTINHHLSAVPDGKPTQATVNAALALKPTLQAILDQTQDPMDTYGPTGEPNEVVNSMAGQYLGYLDAVEYWNANAVEFIGQHSPQFTEFVYEPPAAVVEKKAPPPYKLELKNQGASYPEITVGTGGAISVKNFHKAVVNSSMNAQFVIHDASTNGRLFLTPTSSLGGLKSGTKGVKGMCWGLIPGEPSASSVARLLALFQDATGISAKPPTKKDKQLLYMSQQLAIHQNGGTFKPQDGASVIDAAHKEGMDLYREGKTDEALEILRTRTASVTGVGVKQLDKLLQSDAIEGEHDARGNGFRRTMRPQSREDLIKTLGKNTYVAHNLLGASSVLDFMQTAISNGALLSNEVKPFYGVTKQGKSPTADFGSGGSNGIFCCFRKAVSSFRVQHVYFDLELCRRLDIYMIPGPDDFGNTDKTRWTTPEKWREKASASGGISEMSPDQLVVRHDIDLQRYLVKAKCASQHEADQCIQLVKNAGWSFQRGTPEKIFIA